VVAVSEGVRHDLIQLLDLEKHKVHTIYNPIIDARLKKMGSEVLKHHWFESRQVPVILAVGRLSVEKDYPTLIRAFQLVRQKRLTRLLILGEGEEKTRLQSLVNELFLSQDVEFTGFVANPFAFMKQASCCAISSTFEGFGNVIVESLAMGCCVVSTDCPSGPSEILNGGEFGRMVPVGDVTAMAGAILQTLNDGCCLSSLSSLNSHLQKFEIESVTKQYCDLFDRLIKRHVK
jgi:glycosyltransferase involved in cell wall biosynthesis